MVTFGRSEMTFVALNVSVPELLLILPIEHEMIGKIFPDSCKLDSLTLLR